MALKSQGTFVSRAGVEVGELTGFTGPARQSSKIDVTHLRSIAKEYLVGLKDNGSLTFTGFWLPEDPAQMAMRSDQDAQASAAYTLTLSDGAVMSFNAFVEQMEMSIAPDGAVGLSGALLITGDPVWS